MKNLNTNPQYCYEKRIVDWHNGEYELVNAMKGVETMFCILIDNEEEDLRYLDRRGSTNISEFNDLVTRHRSYIWPQIQRRILVDQNSKQRKKTKLMPEKGRLA